MQKFKTKSSMHFETVFMHIKTLLQSSLAVFNFPTIPSTEHFTSGLAFHTNRMWLTNHTEVYWLRLPLSMHCYSNSFEIELARRFRLMRLLSFGDATDNIVLRTLAAFLWTFLLAIAIKLWMQFLSSLLRHSNARSAGRNWRGLENASVL